MEHIPDPPDWKWISGGHTEREDEEEYYDDESWREHPNCPPRLRIERW